jgi:hypothetical protein
MSNHKDPEVRKAYAKAHYQANKEKRKAQGRAYYQANKEEHIARAKKWREVNLEVHRAMIRANSRKHSTGVDALTFAAMLDMQKGKCAVCGCDVDGNNAHADHDHLTKRPRGVLCRTCNTVEGMLLKKGLKPEVFGALLQRYLDNPTYDVLELI